MFAKKAGSIMDYRKVVLSIILKGGLVMDEIMTNVVEVAEKASEEILPTVKKSFTAIQTAAFTAAGTAAGAITAIAVSQAEPVKAGLNAFFAVKKKRKEEKKAKKAAKKQQAEATVENPPVEG